MTEDRRSAGATATATSTATAGSAHGAEAQLPEQDTALDRRYQAFASRAQKAPGGRLLLKAVVFVVGLLFVAGGIALAVLPGPLTIPPVLVGVYVWSLEFVWARRLRVRVTRSAQQTWASARQHPVRAGTITVLGLVAAGVAVWAVTHYDLVDRAKNAIS